MGMWSSLTGKDAAKAAREAARSQEMAADEAIHEIRGSSGRSIDELLPYQVHGGKQLQHLVVAANAKPKSTLVPGALEHLADQVSARSAARGKFGSGQFTNDLLRANYDVLQRDRVLGEELKNANFNRRNVLANMGYQATRDRANLRSGSSQSIANLRTGQGDARAGGYIGAANAKSQGVNNLVSLGTQAASMVAGVPPMPKKTGGSGGSLYGSPSDFASSIPGFGG
tara:strand:- start:27 stop:707 length:681 start_codon:yes stop_codon:yes gene_type:complete